MAAHTGERAAGPHPLLARHGDRYGLLLLLLIFSYVISAFTAAKYTGAFETLLFVVTLLLALRTSHVRKRTLHLIMGITVAGTVSMIALALGHASDVGLGIANIWAALVLLLTVGVILRRVLTTPVVSLQSIFGAVSAYMIIGLMFASIYSALSRLESGPFFSSGSPADTRTFQYFSFTTLTTLGYGDFTAGTDGGRAVAVMEAMGGQIFLATLVARLVASYRTTRRADVAQPGSTGPGSAGPSPPGNGRPGNDRPGNRRPGTDSPRRGNVVRPRASRSPPVKWRSARRR